MPANAAWEIVDAFNLAPVVPIVLDALMAVATGGYEFFVGNGSGIIYIMVWGFLAVSLSLYLLKLYFPKMWVSFFGFTGGGDLANGNLDEMTISTNMLKPAFRAIIAATLLLQIQPVYLTQWLVNPFLQFGAMYTRGITEVVNESGVTPPNIQCPPNIIEKRWISEDSCKFLIQPVSDVSHANNQVIKRGFQFIAQGLKGMLLFRPQGGSNLLNVITGLVLVTTFVGSNLFMATLIIQAIFQFGMALILYPFQVLTYVVKSSDKWFDIWPAFSGITKALQDLIITMIACAFILCVNVAIIKSLFQWTGSVFITGGGASGFGQHSMLWLSSILTFYLLFRIFDMTRDQLKKYTSGVKDTLHKQVAGDAKRMWDKAINLKDKAKTVMGWDSKK